MQGVLGTFDSLNPFIVKGLAPPPISAATWSRACWRAATTSRSRSTACSPTPSRPTPTRSYVTFTLDPAARFSDGKPVTADDVIFSWQLLRDKGRPNYRTYYAKVAKAEAIVASASCASISPAPTTANCR